MKDTRQLKYSVDKMGTVLEILTSENDWLGKRGTGWMSSTLPFLYKHCWDAPEHRGAAQRLTVAHCGCAGQHPAVIAERSIATKAAFPSRNEGEKFNWALFFFSPSWEILPRWDGSCPTVTRSITYAFISSHLDYFDTLSTCLNQQAVARLQVVQIAAGGLLIRTEEGAYYSYWHPYTGYLSVSELISIFYSQLPRLVKAVALGSELLTPSKTERSLRSRGRALLAVSKSRIKTEGDRTFALAAPKLCKALPKVALKTHLYFYIVKFFLAVM